MRFVGKKSIGQKKQFVGKKARGVPCGASLVLYILYIMWCGLA